MSQRLVVTCDGLGDSCEEDAADPSWPTMRAARAFLAKVGWTSDGTHDYCPGCSLELGRKASS